MTSLSRPLNMIIQIFSLMCVKIILEYNYMVFVNPLFSYEGFEFNFKIKEYFIGWMVFFVGVMVLQFKKHLKIIDFYYLIFIFWYLPNIILYSFVFHNFYYLLLLQVPFLLIVIFTISTNFKIKTIRMGKPVSIFLSLIMIFAVLGHYLFVTGGNLNFDFSKVYDQRDMYGEDSASGLFGYLNSWVFKIFSVLILAWSFTKKSKLLISFSIFIILLLFGFSGHKSSLVGMILVPFFFYIFKRRKVTDIMIVGVLIFLFISQIVVYFSQNILYGSIIFRRAFMLPAYLNYIYLEFFSNNPFVYWENSAFNVLPIKSSYNTQMVYVIGAYLNHPNMSANTGFIASGFANAGVIGIVIYCVIIVFFMNIINAVLNTNNKFLVFSLTIMPLISLFTSSDLPTTLLTHGLLIAVLLLFIYSERNCAIKFGNLKYDL